MRRRAKEAGRKVLATGMPTNQGLLRALLVSSVLPLAYQFPAAGAAILLLPSPVALVAGTLARELRGRRPKTGGSGYSS